jgi:hypothetical protein
MRIQIGDEVVPRQLGPPGVGVVFGILKADMWACTMASRRLNYWDDLYPEWKDGYVAHIYFKKPQKPYTYEEFISLLPDVSSHPEADLRVLYKYNVQYVAVSTYPIIDLDIVEKD